MANNLIDELPELVRLPIRGLIGVTFFVLTAAIVSTIVWGVFKLFAFLGSGAYSLIGPNGLWWALGIFVAFAILSYIGHVIEDSR